MTVWTKGGASPLGPLVLKKSAPPMGYNLLLHIAETYLQLVLKGTTLNFTNSIKIVDFVHDIGFIFVEGIKCCTRVCCREMEASRLIHMSTPGCSPISTPAKKDRPEKANTTPPEGADTNGHLSDESDIKELEDDVEDKNGDEVSDGKKVETLPSKDTSEGHAKGTDTIDGTKEPTRPAEYDSEVDSNLPTQSMVVEVGSELQDVTTNTTVDRTSLPLSFQDSESNKHKDNITKSSWQSSKR